MPLSASILLSLGGVTAIIVMLPRSYGIGPAAVADIGEPATG
jgi:hypothetical protein